jgi:hypothetical protein
MAYRPFALPAYHLPMSAHVVGDEMSIGAHARVALLCDLRQLRDRE